jgi:HTH-type transcriptional regulator/antitoxin PezA
MNRSPTSNDRIIAENITRLRKAHKLSRPQFAHELGLSNGQIEKYENGSNRVPLSRAIEICAVLNCSLADLCEGTTPTLYPSRVT